ncbi:MAG: GNAT family N-acetyltransferase [Pseudonocardiales bacterium]|nr:GNAT family N-acetyltransferase [Actinomycetota bacterium]
MLERNWVGRRVTVRRVVDRSSDGRLLLSDVVGDLLSLSDDTAVIDGRAGAVEVAVDRIAAAKLAWPSTADELALEAVAARGWRPEQTGAVGGWLLRAAGGFTGRANSVLPLRAPGLPLDEALAAAREWYRERDLPLRIQVPLDARRLLDAGLAERGWPADPDVYVLAARLDALARESGADAPPVQVGSAPGPGWFARYRDGAGATTPARALLTRHDRAGFASVTLDGEIAAIGRGVIDDEWLGVSAVEVAPDLRRRGLATAVMQALWRWGAAAGAQRCYVQVSSDNTAAVALYERLGYWRHHDYRYRQDPV